jgi:hypothetical protein
VRFDLEEILGKAASDSTGDGAYPVPSAEGRGLSRE